MSFNVITLDIVVFNDLVEYRQGEVQYRGTFLYNKVIILLNNLARIILSADIRTHIDSMMADLKWLKLDQRWSNHILVMLFKCLTGKSS